MEPVLGFKMKQAKAEKELAMLRTLLLPGEEVRFYGVCNNLAPLMNNIAVTNYRLIGCQPLNVRKSFWHTESIELTPDAKKGTLTVASGGEAGTYTFKMVHKGDHEPIAQLLLAARESVDVDALAAARSERDEATAAAEEARDEVLSGTWPGTVVLNGPIKQKPSLAIERLCAPGERPWLIIHSFLSGVLVAWDDRLAIIKTGGLTGFSAGAMGGERSATFYFNDITGIEYNSGMVNGVLEVLTASYNGTANKDFWRGSTKGLNSDSNNPMTLSNTLPLNKPDYHAAMEHINELRRRIAEAKRPQVVMAQQHPPTDLASQLAQLARLRDNGVLSEDEFSAAKQRLLGS